MLQTHHTYEATVTWAEGVHGTAGAEGRPKLAVGAPPEFGGDAERWSPEHLCVSSLNACLMLTFLAVAKNSRLSFTSYAATATGELEKVEGRGFVFTRFVVRPRIVVPAGVERAKVEQVVRLSKKNCFISNSLTAEVEVEPEIVVG